MKHLDEHMTYKEKKESEPVVPFVEIGPLREDSDEYREFRQKTYEQADTISFGSGLIKERSRLIKLVKKEKASKQEVAENLRDLSQQEKTAEQKMAQTRKDHSVLKERYKNLLTEQRRIEDEVNSAKEEKRIFMRG